MANVSITAANFKLASENCRLRAVTYGENSITAGMPVYLKSDGKYWKTDGDTLNESLAKGIVYVGGSANDLGCIVEGGSVILGGTLVAGTEYVVSSSSGLICPKDDATYNVTGDYITSLGFASSTTVLPIRINATGIAKP